jgi:copper transport protein
MAAAATTSRAAAALLVLMLAAGPAWGHAVLIGAEPASGAVLAEAPARFVLRFNEPVRVLRLSLAGPRGETGELAGHAADGEVTATPTTPPGTGTHVLSWRVVSADGHPVAGTLVFSVGAPGGTALAPEAGFGLAAALWVARVALFACALLAVGAAAFAAWIGPAPRPCRLLAGLLAAAVLPGLQGLDLLGLPLPDLAGAAPWRAGLASGVAVQAGLAAAAILLAQVPGRGAALAALAALAAIGGCAASAGHASTAAPQWLMRPAMAVHAGGMALWLGSLPPLLGLLRHDPAGLPSVLRRYGAVVAPAFVLLLASGLAIAVVQAGGDVLALAATPYGWILSAKLVLVTGIVLAAVRHRLVLTPRIAAPAAQRAMARGIRLELAAALLVVGLARGWRFTPPPRALAAAEPLHIHLHDPKAMADITLAPGRPGRNAAAIVVQTAAGTPLAAREVTLRASNPALGIEAIEQPARRDADGIWRATLHLPSPGLWTIGADILVTDFDLVTVEDQVQLPP